MEHSNKKLIYQVGYPFALLGSAACVALIPSPERGTGIILAYALALAIQVVWLLLFFSDRSRGRTLYTKFAVAVNVSALILAAIAIVAYSINGEVFGINLDLTFGPPVAAFIAVVLLLLLVIGAVTRVFRK
ncbi:hypothetical protein [Corynebacterium amycolatum]|uniref:hypothetical protein n=1 Tax=Corynebacterium amycolatum TaxID=43765 RepID=UPI003EE1EC72